MGGTGPLSGLGIDNEALGSDQATTERDRSCQTNRVILHNSGGVHSLHLHLTFLRCAFSNVSSNFLHEILLLWLHLFDFSPRERRGGEDRSWQNPSAPPPPPPPPPDWSAPPPPEAAAACALLSAPRSRAVDWQTIPSTLDLLLCRHASADARRQGIVSRTYSQVWLTSVYLHLWGMIWRGADPQFILI